MCRIKRAFKRHVPGVHGVKAARQDAYFMPFDRLPCKLRVKTVYIILARSFKDEICRPELLSRHSIGQFQAAVVFQRPAYAPVVFKKYNRPAF